MTDQNLQYASQGSGDGLAREQLDFPNTSRQQRRKRCRYVVVVGLGSPGPSVAMLPMQMPVLVGYGPRSHRWCL